MDRQILVMGHKWPKISALAVDHRMQMDYVFFFYCLGFVLLAGACCALGKAQGSRLPWLWLALFGVTHGLHEWLGLFAPGVGTASLLYSTRLALMALSFAFLLEFLRRSMRSCCAVSDSTAKATALAGVAHICPLQQTVNDSLRFLQVLIDAIPNPVFYKDINGGFLGCNDAYACYFGVTKERVRGATLSDLFPPELAEAYREEDEELLANGGVQTIEAKAPRADGTFGDIILCRATYLNPDGEVGGLIGTIMDITGRKQVEEALRESEERYRAIVDQAAEGIFVVDSQGRYLDANPSGCDLVGYTLDELRQLTVLDLSPEEDLPQVHASFATLVEGGAWTAEFRLKRRDGTIVSAEINAKMLADGRIQGFVRDISERKQAEMALEWEAQVNSAMAELSSAVLSTPSIEAISQLVLAHVKQITGSTLGFVGYIDPRTDCFVCPTICDDETAMIYAASVGRDAGGPEHPHSWVLRHQDSLLFNDADHNPGWPDESGRHACVRRLLSVPATLGDEMLGRIVLANPGRDFTERDLSCVKRLSSLYAIAIKRERTEDELRIQTSAINATSDQVVITDLEGRIEFVNPAFEEETGYKAQEVIGQNPRILKSGRHNTEFYADMWSTIKGGHTWHGEVTNIRKDGSMVVEDVTITPVNDESGKLEHFVAIKRNVTDKKVYEQQLDYLAYHDPLTGLPNRLLFSDRLTRRLARARETDQKLAVMFIDVDRFKLINDTLGHNVGDWLLKGIAERLQLGLSEVDTIARMGGDEFTIIVSNMEDEESVIAVANRILGILREPFQFDDHELFVTVSIGISTYPADGIDVETLVKNADTAMYRAKDRGRGNCQLFTEAFNAADLERMTLEHGLRKALERDEFLLHYQPQVDMKTGKTLGCEALIRWRHPECGLVPPGKFIALAEETGLIVPISEWVLRTACARNKAWQNEGHSPIVVAVNISARLLHQEDLVETVSKALAETHLEPQFLELELTESALMENTEVAIGVLHRLKAMGVKISVDDFGTGYSSLSYLKKFPIDSVKIDQSFIRDITTNPDDAAISGAVIAMAHSLKLKVIAEGVETVEQLEFLQSLKCDGVQGYFISRPMPAEHFGRILENTSGAPGSEWDLDFAA